MPLIRTDITYPDLVTYHPWNPEAERFLAFDGEWYAYGASRAEAIAKFKGMDRTSD